LFHLNKLFFEKIGMLEGGLLGTTLRCGIGLSSRPVDEESGTLQPWRPRLESRRATLWGNWCMFGQILLAPRWSRHSCSNGTPEDKRETNKAEYVPRFLGFGKQVLGL
jgi:hypothetical protein